MRASLPLSIVGVLAVGAFAASPAGAADGAVAPAAGHAAAAAVGRAAAFRPRVIPGLGETRAQIAVRAGGTIGLTAKAAREYRRGKLAITCSHPVADDGDGPLSAATFESGDVVALKPRVRLRLPMEADSCSVAVQVREGNSRSGKSIGQVAISAAGLERLRRENTVAAMVLYLPLVGGQEKGISDKDRERLADALYVFGKRVPVLRLGAPDAAVPAGSMGWFKHERRFVSVATLPDGQRLFHDHDAATKVTTTNVLEDLGGIGMGEPDW
jgi:hypothetical protein